MAQIQKIQKGIHYRQPLWPGAWVVSSGPLVPPELGRISNPPKLEQGVHVPSPSPPPVLSYKTTLSPPHPGDWTRRPRPVAGSPRHVSSRAHVLLNSYVLFPWRYARQRQLLWVFHDYKRGSAGSFPLEDGFPEAGVQGFDGFEAADGLCPQRLPRVLHPRPARGAFSRGTCFTRGPRCSSYLLQLYVGFKSTATSYFEELDSTYFPLNFPSLLSLRSACHAEIRSSFLPPSFKIL